MFTLVKFWQEERSLTRSIGYAAMGVNMPGNFDEFTTEQVRAIIKKQGFITAAMAKIIAEETGRSVRNIIAASAALGNYNQNSAENAHQARARYIPPSQKEGGWLLNLSGMSKMIIYFALALFVTGLVARCVMNSGPDDDVSSGQVSSVYAQCEAELKPKLSRCLQGPESTWEACGEAYMSEFKSCTSE
jgi:hypothetical protein